MRDINPAAAAALADGSAKMAWLVYLDLAAGPLRLTSAGRTVSWDGYDWFGVGQMGRVEPDGERAGEAEQGAFKMSLSGVSQATLASVLSASVRRRRAQLWVGVFDAEAEEVLDALLISSTRMSQATIVRSQGQRTVSVTTEPLSRYMSRPRPYRHTDAEQRAQNSGDTSHQYIVAQAQQSVTWPTRDWLKKHA